MLRIITFNTQGLNKVLDPTELDEVDVFINNILKNINKKKKKKKKKKSNKKKKKIKNKQVLYNSQPMNSLQRRQLNDYAKSLFYQSDYINIKKISAKRIIAGYAFVSTADVIFLNETKLKLNDHLVIPGFNTLHNSNQTCTQGISIIIRKNFKIVSHKIIIQGRLSHVVLKINATEFNLIGVYAPNNSILRSSFFDKVNKLCSNLKNIIIAGDFNHVQDISRDCFPPRKPYPMHLRRSFSKLINNSNLRDPGELNRLFTHRNTHGGFSRLDFFLISSNIKSTTTRYAINPRISDHSPIMIDVKIKKSNFNWFIVPNISLKLCLM